MRQASFSFGFQFSGNPTFFNVHHPVFDIWNYLNQCCSWKQNKIVITGIFHFIYIIVCLCSYKQTIAFSNIAVKFLNKQLDVKRKYTSMSVCLQTFAWKLSKVASYNTMKCHFYRKTYHIIVCSIDKKKCNYKLSAIKTEFLEQNPFL